MFLTKTLFPARMLAVVLVVTGAGAALWAGDDKKPSPPLPPSDNPPPATSTNSIGMKFALIPAGKFRMGSSSQAEIDRAYRYIYKENETPHEVEITRPFYLGIYTVTVGQFREFVKDTGYQTERERGVGGGHGPFGGDEDFFKPKAKAKARAECRKFIWNDTPWEQTDQHPVVYVSWNDAVKFCQWLSKKEGKRYRLPTEAEWEYACRAKTTTMYFSGEDEKNVKEFANIQDISFKRAYDSLPHAPWAQSVTYGPDNIASRIVDWDDGYPFTAPVGKFKPNAFGLYDIQGNVWQWCGDWYNPDYYAHSPEKDPQGGSCEWTFPGAATYQKEERGSRVLRGSSFFCWPTHCRVANRWCELPCFSDWDIGFRVVLALPSGLSGGELPQLCEDLAASDDNKANAAASIIHSLPDPMPLLNERVQLLLADVNASADARMQERLFSRIVTVLKRLGTAEAKELLGIIRDKAPKKVAEEARAALDRLTPDGKSLWEQQQLARAKETAFERRSRKENEAESEANWMLQVARIHAKTDQAKGMKMLQELIRKYPNAKAAYEARTYLRLGIIK